MKLVIAEKPSVGMSIAQVLGARSRANGYVEGNGYVVSWAVGHLVQLAPPEAMNASWKGWSLDHLPLLPFDWVYEVCEGTKDQFKVLKGLLRAKGLEEVVCATDAGREGEHIFRLIYQQAGCKAPMRRLWISSLTEEAIQRGFQNLRPGRDFDGLARAAEGRDKADWLVGMTLTRLYTLLERKRAPVPSASVGKGSKGAAGSNNVWSVGRVQTPTLTLIVERDLRRLKFARTPYRVVRAAFGSKDSGVQGVFHRGVKNDSGEVELSSELPSPQVTKLILPTEDAAAIVERVRAAGMGRIGTVDSKTHKEPPPLLYDLTALQQRANELWGWQASHTLAVAQKLYQEHKVLSYPRTASRYLDEETAASVPAIFEAVVGGCRGLMPAGAGSASLAKRFVDSSKVGDHHALIPTGRAVPGSLAGDDRALYELVVRRFLQMWCASLVVEKVRAEVIVLVGHFEDLFVVRGSLTKDLGWKALEPQAPQNGEAEEDEQALPPWFRTGAEVPVLEVSALDKTKSPPPAYTEASLLKAMETAGKKVDDPELAAALKERGLGTPATRAAIIEGLVKHQYIERDGKALRATKKGIELVARVDPEVRTPEITGRWEQRLERISRGEETLEGFLSDVARYLTSVVERANAVKAAE